MFFSSRKTIKNTRLKKIELARLLSPSNLVVVSLVATVTVIYSYPFMPHSLSSKKYELKKLKSV